MASSVWVQGVLLVSGFLLSSLWGAGASGRLRHGYKTSPAKIQFHSPGHNRCQGLWRHPSPFSQTEGSVRSLPGVVSPAESRPVSAPVSSALIESFYAGQRYWDRRFPQRFLRSGARLEPQAFHVVEFEGVPLSGFYRFNKLGLGEEFAAAFGVGIVALRVLDKAEYQLSDRQWSSAVQAELQLPEFLASKGLRSAQPLGIIKDGERVTIIKSYEEGPSLVDLVELRESGRLNLEEWNVLFSKYEEYVARLGRIIASPEYQAWAKEKGLPPRINWGHSSFALVDGEWTLIHF